MDFIVWNNPSHTHSHCNLWASG